MCTYARTYLYLANQSTRSGVKSTGVGSLSLHTVVYTCVYVCECVCVRVRERVINSVCKRERVIVIVFKCVTCRMCVGVVSRAVKCMEHKRKY